MTRQEFLELVEHYLERVRELFEAKNVSYGRGSDVFYNFRETAGRLWDDSYAGMFKVLMTYVDKHMIALSNAGLAEKEAEQRLLDIIVYCLIGLAMVAEAGLGEL